MKIKLSKDEFELLSAGAFLTEDLLAKMRSACFSGEAYAVDVSEEDASLICHLCGEELEKRGFDAQSNPTNIALLLKSLIRKFIMG